MYEVIVGYIVGSIAAVVLFRHVVREHIVKATLDTLIDEEYVRAYEDDDGITQLYTWREAVDLDVWESLERAVQEMGSEKKIKEMIQQMEQELEDEKEDDTP